MWKLPLLICVEVDVNLFCFLKVVHIHIKHIYDKWRHFQLSRQVWIFNWGHKMLKYALVEVFEEKENSSDFVVCDNCRECYTICAA